MDDLRIVGVEAERLARIRERGADEFGNAWTARTAQGWEPLRCCLTRAGEGAQIALICHTPWSEPSPWLEAGPVFVHFGPCAGYLTPELYPEQFSSGKRTVNPFGHDGERVYEYITFMAEDDDHEAVVRETLARPEVAFLHVRSATAGCFTFEVRPAG
ncbi:MAG: DUF1203 domain-containing protein [Labedaea sp.]